MNYPENEQSQSWFPVHGVHTAKFGQWATEYLTGIPQGFKIIYDHGDSRNPNVAQIKGFYGEQVTNRNRLTDIDIMIAKQNSEIALLIEIEEKDCSPKKYIGTIFSALLCNRFAVKIANKQVYFSPTENTKFVIAGVLPTKNRLKRPDNIILPRIREFNGLSESVKPENIQFIFTDDINQTVEKLKEFIKNSFPK